MAASINSTPGLPLSPCEPAKIAVSELFALREIATAQQLQGATPVAPARDSQETLPEARQIAVSEFFALQELAKGQVDFSVPPLMMPHASYDTPQWWAPPETFGNHWHPYQMQAEYWAAWLAGGLEHHNVSAAYSGESTPFATDAIFQAARVSQGGDSDCSSVVGHALSGDSTEEGLTVSECTSEDEAASSRGRPSPARCASNHGVEGDGVKMGQEILALLMNGEHSPAASDSAQEDCFSSSSPPDVELDPPPGLLTSIILREPPQSHSIPIPIDFVNPPPGLPVSHDADGAISPPPGLGLSLEPPPGLPIRPLLDVPSSPRVAELPAVAASPDVLHEDCWSSWLAETQSDFGGYSCPEQSAEIMGDQRDAWVHAVKSDRDCSLLKTEPQCPSPVPPCSTAEEHAPLHNCDGFDSPTAAGSERLHNCAEASFAVTTTPVPVDQTVPVLREVGVPLLPRPRSKARVEQGRRRCKGQNLQSVPADIKEVPKLDVAAPTSEPTSEIQRTGSEIPQVGWRFLHLLLVLGVVLFALAAWSVYDRQLHVSNSPMIHATAGESAWPTESPLDTSKYMRERTVNAFGKGMEIEIARANAAAASIKSKNQQVLHVRDNQKQQSKGLKSGRLHVVGQCAR